MFRSRAAKTKAAVVAALVAALEDQHRGNLVLAPRAATAKGAENRLCPLAAVALAAAAVDQFRGNLVLVSRVGRRLRPCLR